jgi:7-cyano-7-deazaguanine tRNA-ribosyltransferase
VELVAGLSIKNLQPRVWDRTSPFYLRHLQAVMVSYGEFDRRPALRKAAMNCTLRQWLGAPEHVRIYLDNGSFYFNGRRRPRDYAEYEAFVTAARPDWWPIPQDFIPLPKMSARAQRACFERTMDVNRRYEHDGFVPVVHVGLCLSDYLAEMQANAQLSAKSRIALGGIVPNLLRAPKALSYESVIQNVRAVRDHCSHKRVHVFGMGGTATLHLAAVLGVDSADSSGWRNRAARGIIQLPGSGDRVVAELGSWRGRRPSAAEWKRLNNCECPACGLGGPKMLRASGLLGFVHRATHNLWVLLEEVVWIKQAFARGDYAIALDQRLDNSAYLPLLRLALAKKAEG